MIVISIVVLPIVVIATAGPDAIAAIITTAFIVAGMDDGRDMTLMEMRMVLLLRMVLIMLIVILVLVAVIIVVMMSLKVQRMIHASAVNRARNWGHVLLRLDLQRTQQR